MIHTRTALREELSERLLPELRRLGFVGPPRIAGNVLQHEFRRASPRGTDVVLLQMEKHGRPRFLLRLHVEPLEGLDAVMARGGTVIAGAVTPRPGASNRNWFRADPEPWQRWTGSARTSEREAVDACLALLPEVESWWDRQRPTAHIAVWPVTYGVGEPRAAPFLTARWLRLAMINYEVDPGLLRPRAPRGTEVDTWNGRCFVSMVGFRFVDTRVLGIAVPFHRDFLEVNLRFYVRRTVKDEVRRGVVFVKELVPRRALAWVANLVYNENYQALPMSSADTGDRVEYSWQQGARPGRMSVAIDGESSPPSADSEEQFITEHYWGYVTQRDGSTVEYRVEHPPWRVWRGHDAHLECDVDTLYGAEFAPTLLGKPSSCFLADGSEVLVRRGVKLKGSA